VRRALPELRAALPQRATWQALPVRVRSSLWQVLQWPVRRQPEKLLRQAQAVVHPAEVAQAAHKHSERLN